ncbi:acyl-CoA thioesterase [Prochlorococcus sp. MIT 1223]|uniref:acyl-CoA thioesterase n=1 Tax=Prochlorococcus sp. MIT 1223 TaxID=3096217 RepID=UPI002A7516BC|nr:acyl-CoA thioesterase [Prochlorococcus sp. MIT 1223]
MGQPLKKKPWLLRKTVLPQHTDHAGIMWHGSYLNWLEESRINALSQAGLSYSNISENGYEMPVVEVSIKYQSSLNHGDEVILKSWLLDSEGARLPWKTVFIKECGKPSAEAIVHLVTLKRIDSGLRIVRRFPDEISKALENLRQGPTKDSLDI